MSSTNIAAIAVSLVATAVILPNQSAPTWVKAGMVACVAITTASGVISARINRKATA